MIATLAFAPPQRGVRRARFVPCSGLPVDAACVVANGVREGLRTLLGEACTVTIGEPVALDAAAWRSLTGDALLFATPGRATDVVFVLALRDARRLVAAAFGEDPATAGPWSALEAGAVERIVARCAIACEALCVERRGPTAAVEAGRIPPSVAYFDVRVAAPVTLTLGVGILRELPTTPPPATLGTTALDGVALEVRAVLGRGPLPVPSLLGLRVGSVVPLGTKVEGEGELNVAGQRIAFGTGGLRNGRTAFEVRSITLRGDPW
ncbi:MAG TPA: FliM/FliN family flagellar motor C-terminal domain-containing protein [Candidatus Lustribacter sp.]|nr:FliM/FliN family flagellar motor C-terminal domain-containing protein [Candidatus Lustribacter sp.]